MTVADTIDRKLRAALSPTHLDVRNESGKHNVRPGSETHFKVSVVSAAFEGRSRVERHKAVNRALAEELAGPVHALAIGAFTPPEWRDRAKKPVETPDCLGGEARESAGRSD